MLVSTDNGLLHRWWSLTATIRGSGKTSFIEGSLHPWAPQSGSRHPVKAWAEAWEIEASPRGGVTDLEFGQAEVDLFASQETTHCPLWFSLTHPAPK